MDARDRFGQIVVILGFLAVLLVSCGPDPYCQLSSQLEQCEGVTERHD